MVRNDLFYVKRILLHADKVCHIVKGRLHDAVVVSRAVELWTDDLVHQTARLGRVVSLDVLSF